MRLYNQFLIAMLLFIANNCNSTLDYGCAAVGMEIPRGLGPCVIIYFIKETIFVMVYIMFVISRL